MNLRDKNLKIAFICMLFLSLFCPVIFPKARLLFFASFLILVIYQKSYPKALQWAFFSGLILDFFSSPVRFGLHALNFTLTTFFLYPQKRAFFADSFLTLPLMTYLFSFLSTFLQLILLFIFSKKVPLSFALFFTDLMIMPFLDAFFSLSFFIPNLIFKPNFKT